MGDVGFIKGVSEFLFGHPKCHVGAHKDGHFGWLKNNLKVFVDALFEKSIAHLVCDNFKLRDANPSKNSETNFISPKFPKNYGIVFS